MKYSMIRYIQKSKLYYNKISVIKDLSKFQDKYVLNLVKCMLYT